MLRDGKQHFFDQYLNNVDAKTFWKTIRLLNQECSSSRIPALQDIDGAKIIDSNLDKGTTLNKFFYTCFNHSQSTLMDPPMIPGFPQMSAQLSCYASRNQFLSYSRILILPNPLGVMESHQKCLNVHL